MMSAAHALMGLDFLLTNKLAVNVNPRVGYLFKLLIDPFFERKKKLNG
jgi:hypothetical protein